MATATAKIDFTLSFLKREGIDPAESRFLSVSKKMENLLTGTNGAKPDVRRKSDLMEFEGLQTPAKFVLYAEGKHPEVPRADHFTIVVYSDTSSKKQLEDDLSAIFTLLARY